MTPNSQSNLPLGNGATPLFADPFTGAATIENKWTVLKAGTSKSPGLTASGTTTAPTGGIPGFANPAIDAAGSGVLRLTDNTASQSGAVIYNQSVFSKAGISIEFEYFQYGGTAVNGQKGDGISFFLLDGAQATPTQAGGFGGGLGYAQNTVLSQAGIAGGYLGIGFDSFGNFGKASEGRVGGITGDSNDRVTVRGSAAQDYKYLTNSDFITIGIDNAAADATRANSSRLVRIDVAADGKLTVKLDLNGNKTFEANETVINNYDTIAGGNSALPDTVKFGFAASTGGATNNQEIRELKISSIADLFGNSGGTVSYTAGAAAIALAPTLTVNTIVLPTGTTTFNGATVGITPASYKTGQDFLTVGTVTGNVPTPSGTFAGSPLTWAFNTTTGVLTISGAGTPAQYQAAIAQVSYYNNAGAAANISDRTAQYILTGIPGNPSTTSIIKVGAGNSAAKRPEILFQDSSTGEVAFWAVDSTGVLTGAKYLTLGSSFGTASGTRLRVAPGWKVIDTGDVDGDAIADILWYSSTTQEVALHFMTNEGQLKSAGFITSGGNNIKVNATEQWSPVGLADVTGDGKLDINWRAAGSDQIAYWQTAGTTSTVLTGGGFLQNAAGNADFKVGDNSRGVKMGDFDGDGKIDMLLNNGKVVTYGAFTAAVTGTPAKLVAKALVTLPSNGDASLVARAVGDYNGDLTTDVVFESTTADKGILQYINSTKAAKNLLATGTPTAWNIGASKDFSGDLTPDLVWHNSVSGETAIWAIDKLTGDLITTGGVTAFVTVKPATGSNTILRTASSWEVVGADDFGTVTLV
jgi:FG-GAP-like repeat